MEPISAQVFPTEDVRALKLLSADSEEIIEKPETRRKKRKCRGKSLNQSVPQFGSSSLYSVSDFEAEKGDEPLPDAESGPTPSSVPRFGSNQTPTSVQQLFGSGPTPSSVPQFFGSGPLPSSVPQFGNSRTPTSVSQVFGSGPTPTPVSQVFGSGPLPSSVPQFGSGPTPSSVSQVFGSGPTPSSVPHLGSGPTPTPVPQFLSGRTPTSVSQFFGSGPTPSSVPCFRSGAFPSSVSGFGSGQSPSSVPCFGSSPSATLVEFVSRPGVPTYLSSSNSSDIALGAAPLHPPRLLFEPCEPICAMQTENIASLSLHQQSLIKRHRLVDDSSKMSRSKVVKFGDTEIVINDRETEITQKELTTYSIFIELKEWVKCKGGLPLCDFVFTNIQNSAMKENNEELLELLKNVPYCENAISEPEPEILDSDCDDKLRKTIIDMFNIINKNGGFCTEGNLLQKGILKKPFLLYLREAGLNSLGTKASKDIELMVSTLAFLLFCASYFVQFSKKKISGSTEIDKLQHLADFLGETILSEELIAIIKTIKFIICIQHKYSMACQSLGVGKNWEDFILDFIQEPSH
ncbi:uncharacterized protein LOC111632786 isoform X2 [Centruroides sculpturatus]|uniref:uncharacterized protein LOC111632786 isoform X2 n=1 Tax=Centruroides sculpturatus TaxID=218467 RepID=UPI000C6DD74D|nr:uncharacterized protein LOC111632786 isoform X2 [Centruroides sculpturatus]